MSHIRYPAPMRRLINELSKLPTIGEKSATRLAYHLVQTDEREALTLAQSIQECREQICICEQCFFLADSGSCEICQDEQRVRNFICVVEKPADVIAIERSAGFNGLYHVLHGLWSPLRGVSPEKTKINQLFDRITQSRASGTPIEEVVIATGTTVEGDATALYIANALAELEVGATRIAQGMPKGGELEYADEVTLVHALQGRRRFS